MHELLSSLQEAGSFAATWLLSWFLLYLLLWVGYPLLRRHLTAWHPTTASNVVLALLSLPFLVSLFATVLVFSPLLEQNLITAHYHGSTCEEQLALLESPWAIGGVLGLTALAVLAMSGKFLAQTISANRLRTRLLLLGERRGEWVLLPNSERLVFTLGWLENTIFITEGLRRECSEQELAIMLGHEQEHVRRRDNLRLLVSRLLLLIVPAPLARQFSDDLQLFTEASCDFAAAERHGRCDVAQTLVRIQRLVPQRFHYFNATLASAFTGSEVERRVMLLLEGTHGSMLKFAPLIYLLALCLLSLLLVDPLHHGVEWLWRDI